ncbi:MAG: fatty acyl-AMP ligase [Bradymonadia bacterium]
MSSAQPQTLVEALHRAASLSDGPSPAVVRFVDRRERATTFTYGEISTGATAVARQLVALGVQPGERVALVLRTGPEFYDAFFGAQLAGAVPVALYPPVRLGRLESYHASTARMLQAVHARLLVTDRRIRRVLGRTVAALDQLPPDPHHHDQSQPPLDLGCLNIEDLKSAGAHLGDALNVRPAPDDVAFIQFSSGTTGDPKPVELTHRQLLANADVIRQSILKAWPEDPPEQVHSGVSWLPLYHDMGLVGAVITAVLQPGDLTLIPPEAFLAQPALWLRTLSRYRGTVSPAPNFAYGLCLKRIEPAELEGIELSSWRVALNGAEPVTPEVLQRFCDRFAPHGLDPRALTPCYGLAEAALAVTFAPLDAPFEATRFCPRGLAEGVARPDAEGRPLVSVGGPLPGFDVQIRGEAGEILPLGQIGRVFVRGPSIMRGYHRRPEATEAALRAGWLDTGDEGFLHEGARGSELFIYGRGKDLIIIRGRNHAPQDIEHPLDEIPGVRVGCTAAVGHVNPGAEGESLFVFVERDPHVQPAPSDEALMAEVQSRIMQWTGLRADEIHLLSPGTLPRTSSGKIKRRAALAQHLEGTLVPPKAVHAVSLAVEVARSTLAHNRRKIR